MQYANAANAHKMLPNTPGATTQVDGILLLDYSISRLADAVNRVTGLNARLTQKADEVFGSRPLAGSGPVPPSPEPSGKGEGLRNVIGYLHDALNVLESEAERFGAL